MFLFCFFVKREMDEKLIIFGRKSFLKETLLFGPTIILPSNEFARLVNFIERNV